MKELTKWLVDNQAVRMWRYPGGPGHVDVETEEDVSASQFALLGLKAARRCGIKVDPEVFFRALKGTLEDQDKKGPLVQRKVPKADKYGRHSIETVAGGGDRARGWCYNLRDKQAPQATARTGSMTAAAICSLAICKSELTKYKPFIDEEWGPKVDRAIYDGLAWMTTRWTFDRNPGYSWFHYYYLYGIERVGVLTKREYIGDQQWYNTGARWLVDQQGEAGSWQAEDWGATHVPYRTDTVDTAFALLFLRKATIPLDIIIDPPPVID
jgi:hypothetical protein